MKRSRGAGGAGGAAARKAPKVVNVTIHVHNNIHNYFSPRAGPTAAPEGGDQHPPHLFPTTETTIRRREKNPKMTRETYMRVQSKRSAVLCGECANCNGPSRPIADFAPAKHVHSLRDRAAFFEAVSDYTDAYAARDLDAARAARDRVAELRRAYCPSCAAMRKLSPAQQACKDEWIKMRQDACDRHDGCMKPGCLCKGANRDWRVLQADHLPGYVKVRHLSEYMWWSCNGGVAAMLDPRYFVPFNTNALYAQGWALHFNQPDNDAAIEPPEDVKAQQELYKKLLATGDQDKQHEIMLELLNNAADQFLVFGVSLPPDGYGVIKNDMVNTMPVMPNSFGWPTPGPSAPEQFFKN